MERSEAIAFMKDILPFGDNGELYQCNLDGNRIKNLDELLSILLNDYGFVSLNGIDKETNEEVLIFIDIDRTGVDYRVVTPSALNFKLIEAAYALVD